MLFQQAEPAIHKLHDNQVRIIREFLACFSKPEILSQCNSISKLKKLDVEDPQHHLANSLLFIGKKGGNVRSRSKNKNKHDLLPFLRTALQAYVKCGKYMLKKLPLENQLLQCLSSIHPIAILSRSQKTLQQLLKLYEQVDSIFKEVADCYEYGGMSGHYDRCRSSPT